MYVFELANMYQGKPDRELIRLFLRIIERDASPSVRLEAAADIHRFRIPNDLWPQVHTALERCRQDARVDFQVLASQSLLALAARRGTIDSLATATLARIARGEGLDGWEVMVAVHNRGMMVQDMNSSRKIPFETARKHGMRAMAVYALWKYAGPRGKAIVGGMAHDPDAYVRDAVKGAAAEDSMRALYPEAFVDQGRNANRTPAPARSQASPAPAPESSPGAALP